MYRHTLTIKANTSNVKQQLINYKREEMRFIYILHINAKETKRNN